MIEEMRCPVCFGKGIVPEWYLQSYGIHHTSNAIEVVCPNCKGTKVIHFNKPPDFMIERVQEKNHA
jgi:RecJ-like exonuclease